MFVSLSHAELFTALVDLKKVLDAESGVASTLREYVTKEEARLERIKRIADDFDAHSAKALLDPESHLANPVNAFLLVKRFTTDWDYVVDGLIRTNNSEELMADIYSKTSLFPDSEDLSGAATALLRLQDTYALPTDKIAAGDLPGVKESPVMTADDCFELGRMAYNQGDYYHTILWMSHAWDTYEASANATKSQIASVIDYLAYAVYVQGNTEKALELTERWLELEPDHVRAQNNKQYYEQMLAEQNQQRKGDEGTDAVPVTFKNERQLDEYRSSPEFQAYEALCRGEDVVPNPDAHKLTCQYKRHHPIFYLAPLREETMFLDPRIVVYHQLMTDTEIALIKEMAQPRFKRATVQNPQTGELEPAYYRVSKSGWVKDEEHPIIKRVSVKSGTIANLTIETVEELQVVNYGIGGHYEPHYDFARKDEAGSFEARIGNRIATVIYYMTDVEAGGATVFPYIGVKLWPEKGSAAVWYNLKKSGEGDMQTRHAACPVLTGSKWVCNKWFHERGNEFIRPCDVNPAL
jgi:prolyl 4-hydroxylase